MKEIIIKVTDEEYYQYVKKGQLEYRLRMKKAIEDEEYVKWIFMFGKIVIKYQLKRITILVPLRCYRWG